MRKILVAAVFVAALMALPFLASAKVEFYDPLPDVPGKFMGPHGPNHPDWHYHGPPGNEHDHCDAALEDPFVPHGVEHACEDGH